MARLYLLIDGYNLMHAAGLGRSNYGPGELERNRNRLLNQISAALDERVAADASIVFDAHLVTARPDEEEKPLFNSPLTVLFSREGRDADAEIEQILENHSSPKQVLIVSSDHRLHKAASRRKARCIDSEEFLRQLEEPESLQKERNNLRDATVKRENVAADPRGETNQDADYLREFLEIDIADIKRSVRKEGR